MVPASSDTDVFVYDSDRTFFIACGNHLSSVSEILQWAAGLGIFVWITTMNAGKMQQTFISITKSLACTQNRRRKTRPLILQSCRHISGEISLQLFNSFSLISILSRDWIFMPALNENQRPSPAEAGSKLARQTTHKNPVSTLVTLMIQMNKLLHRKIAFVLQLCCLLPNCKGTTF